MTSGDSATDLDATRSDSVSGLVYSELIDSVINVVCLCLQEIDIMGYHGPGGI
jgi:hypothetical protein